MVKRVNYFDGQFLRAKDFNDEQAFNTGMREKHNSLLHTWGVADGLVPSAAQGAAQVTVSRGFAIDIHGREIQLDLDAPSPALTNMAGKTIYVTIAWSETPTDPTTEAGASGDTRVELTPTIGLSETPNSGVELILGKVTVNAQGAVVSVDATTPDRRLAGVKSGDLTATGLTLTGLNIDPSLQPRLSVVTPGQVDLKGALTISNNLGVGTATPQAPLDVGGNSPNNVQAILARGQDANFQLYVANGPGNTPGDLQAKFGLRYGSGDAATLSFIRGGKAQDGSIAFNTLALERMRIDSLGNVGIGVPAPAFKLDVGDRIRLRQGSAVSAGMWLYQTGPNADIAFIGMANDKQVGIFGNPLGGWGLLMDVATANLTIGGVVTDNKVRTSVAKTNTVNTNNTSWTDMPDMKVSWNSSIDSTFQILVQINGVQVTSGANLAQMAGYFQLLLDGVSVDVTRHEFNANGWELRGVTLSYFNVVKAGSHTAAVQWYATSGQVTCCWYSDTRRIQVVEL